MPRSARLNVPGAVFHIISRFHNRSSLMAGAEERARYLDLLGQACSRVDASILGWCLMSTHIHLVVRAGEDPLSGLLKPIHSGFATGLNRSLGRIGPVFADRYKAVLVETEPYLLQLLAYVHNNPVRAGLIQHPEQSYWTSHRAYLGLEQAPVWLDTGFALGHLATSVAEARQMFAELVYEARVEARRTDLSDHGGGEARKRMRQVAGDGFSLSDAILGSEAFADEVIRQMAGLDSPVVKGSLVRRDDPAIEPWNLADVIVAACAAVGVEPWVFDQRPKSPLSVQARQIITYTWVKRCGGKQVDIARHLKVPTSLVSRWYGRAIDRLPDLEEPLEAMKLVLEEQGTSLQQAPRRRIRYALAMEDNDGIES